MQDTENQSRICDSITVATVSELAMVKEFIRAKQSTPRSNVPPLESGDRLTRPEFERRYAAAPHIKKAELIEGIVYVASPLRHKQHGKPHSRVLTWLGVYQTMTPFTDLSV